MRWLFRLMGLVALLAIVLVVSLLMLPGERIARIAADQISSLTGRDVTMQGDTTVTFYPGLKIGVEPQALFGGEIRITGLEAVDPKILLERSADGAVNWKIGVDGVATSGQGENGPVVSKPLALTLDRALITNANLTYINHATGDRIAMPGMNIDLRWPDYEGTAQFDVTLRTTGEAVRVSGHLDDVGSFIAGGVSALEATVSSLREPRESTFCSQYVHA